MPLCRRAPGSSRSCGRSPAISLACCLTSRPQRPVVGRGHLADRAHPTRRGAGRCLGRGPRVLAQRRSTGATSALLVILAEHHLGTGPRGFGLVPGAIGAGAALGLYGIGTSTGMVAYNSLPQAKILSRNRGRLFAGYDMIWQTGRLISLGLGGATVGVLGIQAVGRLGGVPLLLAGSLGLARLRPIEGSAPFREPSDRNTRQMRRRQPGYNRPQRWRAPLGRGQDRVHLHRSAAGHYFRRSLPALARTTG